MAVLTRPQEGLNLIDGQWERGDSADTLEDRDPGNGEIVGMLAQGGPDDADRAVAAARRAQPQWAATAARARGSYLNLAAARLEAEADGWAEVMTREMGKPLREAKVECIRAAKILQFFAGEAHRPLGEQYASDQAQTWLFTRREPVGVVGIITPWNFPAAIP